MAEQLPLPLPARAALGREDYFVSRANGLAVALVEDWVNWPAGKLLLVGPPGAGKTHLAHVWAAESGAQIAQAAALPRRDIPALAGAPICVEDVAAVAGDRAAEEALFHLHNLALAQGQPLLLTADRPPQHWGLSLPDLASRMEGTPSATLPEPDDTLLAAVLAKLFGDRQIVPGPDVIPYLVRHMPRSFATAQEVVAALDAAGLGKGRRITRALAREVVSGLAPEAGGAA
ncbi:AAA family ATPase [Salipiger mucosus]|uniref:Chromosomal replication initiator protein DnaA n=1 Tax=Salipiger mucosus DSM 16094 TaxID=1123237 RepID=S9QZX5_9RHOB|nr:DnaA/Hda family protein [Salipiger mucosus]EPX85132.1 Chromosomal replication initiator protein DnaA [Salipiger mucosus DSM 16094]